MKIFIDTADINEIRQYAEQGLVDGVTTNPSLVAKTGRKLDDVIQDITAVVDGPISVEAVSMTANEMVDESLKIAARHKNLVIKIPLTSEGLKAVTRLKAKGVKTNVTLCFSPSQALLVAKAGAAYVSPFVGRLDDISCEGMDLVSQIMTIYENYGFDTEVIVASIRSPMHFVEAAMMGAHVATVPPAVLGQLVKHPLTDIGIEKFLADWKKVPK